MSGMLPESNVIGVNSEAESTAMEWPWFARITQSEGEVESAGGGVFSFGSGFMEKRFLELLFTAVRMSGKVTLRDLRRGQDIWERC